MTRRTDIIFELSTQVIQERQVYMNMKLTNNSPNDYMLRSNVLLFNGLSSQFFSINGPSKIRCNITPDAHKYFIEFNTHSSISNQILLSEKCHFANAAAGIYTVRFNTVYHLYTKNSDQANNSSVIKTDEYSWLVGESNFALPNCNHSNLQTVAEIKINSNLEADFL